MRAIYETQKQVKSSNINWRAKKQLFSKTKKVKQLHSEIPKFVIIRANQKKMWKITYLSYLSFFKNKLNQTFSPEKFETEAIKISVLCC